ncbi:MAG: ABC transporter ATP-binding protein [Eubacterium sp.]|nr:ABC transporter ATP-binding protein [Eubacterium sp.]
MKKFLKYLKPYRVQCILAPLFKMLEATFELLVPLVIAWLVDVGINEGDRHCITVSAILLFMLAAVGMAAAITAQYFSAKVAMQFGREVRGALFRHIESLSYSNIDRIGTSTLITRMTSDINQMQTGVNMVLRLLLRSPFIVFGATFMAFRVNSKIAIYFVYMLIVLFIVVGAIVFISIPLVKKVQGRLDDVTLHTRENITGVRVIRAFNRTDEESEEFRTSAKLLMKMQLWVGRVSSFLNPVTLVIVNTAIACVIFNGGLSVFEGTMKKGEVIALYNYMSYILIELIKFVNFIITVSKMFAGAKRVSDVMDIKPDIEFSEEDKFEKESEKDIESADEDTKDAAHSVSFKDVSLTYPGAKEPAVSDVTFDAKQGEIIGIIGGTGSGKSSLVSLIPRFYEATSGDITIDGNSIKDYSKQTIRDMVSVVPQHSVLFSGTVAENIKMGNDSVTDKVIEDSLAKAQAKSFIDEKEGKTEFMINAGGRNLSGGQRQRLTIARALAKDAPILILDDSTSALDFATEKELRKVLGNLKSKKIIFLVSQRAGTLMAADRIIVMERGNVAGIGTHDELLQTCEVYQEIVRSQIDEGEVAS